MDKKVRVFEFRTSDGKPLFSIHMFDREEVKGSPGKSSDNPYNQKKGSGDKSYQKENKSDGEFMTQAQKRYLFRILAEQGINTNAIPGALIVIMHPLRRIYRLP